MYLQRAHSQCISSVFLRRSTPAKQYPLMLRHFQNLVKVGKTNTNTEKGNINRVKCLLSHLNLLTSHRQFKMIN